MTEWIFNLKTKLTVLVMMLCSFCVTKVYAVEPGLNTCVVTSGQNINLRNINLTTDDFKPGPDSVIYTINQDATFKCLMGYDTQFPLLVFDQGYFSGFSTKLDAMGLGFRVSIKETGNASNVVSFSWDEIKKTQSGNELRKAFGTVLPQGVTERKVRLTLDFLYTKAYSESSAVTAFTGISNVLNIVPFSYSVRQNGFVLSGFNVRILRNGLGTVDIVPSQVNFGHIYTTYEPSQTRQASFTVIARQALRPAMGQEFTIPLGITFGKGALTQDTGQTLNLVSLDGPNKGQPNGLRLSIKDNKGKEITFDKQELLGDITITGKITGNVSKIYTAVVTPTPGGSVKTGKFSAAIPVTVTYN
ncbi:hypothetical protein FNI15_03600 [Salmonella enterica subsp. salamae]|nr:hypothetical protein [Salmonella enterica subsp. salamae]EDN4179472.1 hypothetical protein [Salmonella enterica subsp. salamae]